MIVKRYSVCGALFSRVEDPLFAAIKTGDVNRVRKLVNLPGCNLVASGPAWLAIHQAAYYGQEDCLSVLLTGTVTQTQTLVVLLSS